MNLSQWKTTIGWLVRDTFRQSLAYGICWILLGVSVLAIGVCARRRDRFGAIGRAGRESRLPSSQRPRLPATRPSSSNRAWWWLAGDLTLAFGAIRIPLARDGQGAVHFLQLVLAGGVADTLGLLLALFGRPASCPAFSTAAASACYWPSPRLAGRCWPENTSAC